MWPTSYINAASFEDVAKIISHGVAARHMQSSNYLELALAMAGRMTENSEQWQEILKTFLAGRSGAFTDDDDDDDDPEADERDSTLTKLIGHMGSMMGRRAHCSLRRHGHLNILREFTSFTVEELLQMVDFSLPSLSASLSRHALENWNSGTVSLILPKLHPEAIRVYLSRYLPTTTASHLNKRTVAVTAAYAETSSSERALFLVRFREQAHKMFAKHCKSWDGSFSSPEDWQGIVRSKDAGLIVDMKRRWPALHHIDGASKQGQREREDREQELERRRRYRRERDRQNENSRRLLVERDRLHLRRAALDLERTRLSTAQQGLDRNRVRLHLELERLRHQRSRLRLERDRLNLSREGPDLL